MALTLEGGCRVADGREGEFVRYGSLRVWRHVGRETGAVAISQEVLEFSPGASPPLRNGDCDEVLFVLSGEGTLVLDGVRHRLGSDTGVYVRPGARWALENPGPAPVTLVGSRCPDPGPSLFFEEPQKGTSETRPSAVAPIVLWEDQPTERAADGRSFRVLVDARAGCEAVTQFIGLIPPGRSPDHFHEYEEVICILAGQGLLWAGQTSSPISSGSCIFLPRRQPHCLENIGPGDLRLHGLFYPAGSPAVRYSPDRTERI